MLARTFSLGRSAARRGFRTTAVLRAEDAVSADTMTLNFSSPYETVFENETVDNVILCGAMGDYGVTANHSAIVSQLRPGVVQVAKEKDGAPEKFFVSGGFAFTHPNSVTDVSVAEVVRVEDLDVAAIQAEIASSETAMAAAEEGSAAHAEAKIGFDTAKEMLAAAQA